MARPTYSNVTNYNSLDGLPANRWPYYGSDNEPDFDAALEQDDWDENEMDEEEINYEDYL